LFGIGFTYVEALSWLCQDFIFKLKDCPGLWTDYLFVGLWISNRVLRSIQGLKRKTQIGGFKFKPVAKSKNPFTHHLHPHFFSHSSILEKGISPQPPK
jgi:hypothetical protein